MKKNTVNCSSIFVLDENGNEIREVNVSVAPHLYGEQSLVDVYNAIIASPAILAEKGPSALVLNDGRTVAIVQSNHFGLCVRRIFSGVKHTIRELAELADSLWDVSEEGAHFVCSL